MHAPKRILVVGSGGREHALAWRLSRDVHAPDVFLAPGPASARSALRSLDVAPSDHAALVDACRRESIGLVVIGPEAPLAAGLADELSAAGVSVFGPGRDAARLEASKSFAKTIMREAGVATAGSERHTDVEGALRALDAFGAPHVVKADGLAAGKGVCVTDSRELAEGFVRDCLERNRFGGGGRSIVVEAFLEGEEVSVTAVCDGDRFVMLTPARDHKRSRDGDQGPNTGGMGAFAPAPSLDAALERSVGERVLAPVLARMRARGTPFRGVLYAGLMLTAEGAQVLEFNVRFGDPETQVVLPLVSGSLSALLAGAAAGRLDPAAVGRAPGAAVAVALVDEGYPERTAGRGVITGLDALEAQENVCVFHAATLPQGGGHAVRGGRAAYVVALGDSTDAARTRAYDGIARLGGTGWRCRRDIAAEAGHGSQQLTRHGGR